MKTNFLSLLITTASAAFVIPLSAQSGPQDLGVEPSLIEQQMQRDMRKIQAFDKLHDLTLTRGKADDEEEWDMVRRLERDRKDQSVDAMVQRMLRELHVEASKNDKPDRIPQGMKGRDQSPFNQQRMNELPRKSIETPDRQRPTWFIGLMVEPLEPFMREHLALEPEVGVKVTRVVDGSPAAKAGIRLNDQGDQARDDHSSCGI